MEIIIIFLYIISFFVFLLFIVRLFSHTEIDDVTPGIQCEDNLITKSNILWVIPIFEGKNISDNSEWVNYIKSKNKILGLHGVYHTFNEFDEKRDNAYIQKGIEEFEKAFGYKPKIFKAPQLALSSENKKIVEDSGMEVKGKWNQLTHKVYHCNDTGMFPNWMIKIF